MQLMNRFAEKLSAHSLPLRRARPEILQVNVGKLCNLTCMHCHVNAGPKRKEIMTRDTIDRIIDWLANADIPIVDLTGGAPEMIPDFRYFIDAVGALQLPRHIIDRCNLTILLEPGYEDLSEFLANNKVEIIASMPCYSAENVNAQRGEGVFDGSIAALQLLNSLGYGIDPNLPLASGLQSGRRISAAVAGRAGGRLQARTEKAFRNCVSTSSMHSRIFQSDGLRVISGITTSSRNIWIC